MVNPAHDNPMFDSSIVHDPTYSNGQDNAQPYVDADPNAYEYDDNVVRRHRCSCRMSVCLAFGFDICGAWCIAFAPPTPRHPTTLRVCQMSRFSQSQALAPDS